jgi:hypothetical protein
VVLAGAHGNKHKKKSEADDAAAGDALLFQQVSHCNVTTWQPFTTSTARGCAIPKDAVGEVDDDGTPEVPILDASANLTEGVPLVAVVDGSRAKDMDEPDPDDPDAKKTRKFPEHDGAFISLKIGGVDMSGISGMMSAKDAIMDNYIIIQGRIVFIGVSLEIDMSIIPGKMEEGGGIYFSFLCKWTISGVPLVEIGGFLDLIPLDIDDLLGMSIFDTLLDMRLMVGIYIKPHILNYVLMLVELIMKLALALIMLPLLILIVIVQYVLIALLFILEKCIGALRDMQRFVQLTAKRINKRLNKMMEREEYFQKLEDRVD